MTADELREKLDELFDKWKEESEFQEEFNKHFHEDGPFKYDIYCNQDVKILFLLKETNGCDNKSFEEFYNKYFDNESPNKSKLTMWRRVREWSEGLLTDKNYEDILAQNIATEQGINDPLRKVAVINVKKHGGGASSKRSELKDYADKDREFIKKEIQLLDPDIIVCGGTWSLLNIIVKETDTDSIAAKLERLTEEDGGKLTIDGIDKPVMVIDMYHPAAPMSKEKVYNMIMEKYKKIKNIINK